MTATKRSEEPSRWFWWTLPIGLVFVAIGMHGIYQQHDATPPAEVARWFVGAGILHDALLAPLFVLVGFATTRFPTAARTPVRLALAASALLTSLAWPLVQGWGRRDANPSALPLDYSRNLVVSIAAIWLVAGVAIGVRLRRR